MILVSHGFFFVRKEYNSTMFNISFRYEKFYALLFLVAASVTGLLTSYWAQSFLIWALVYILWKWVEFYHFYHWYKNGAKNAKVPLNHGVWGDFASLILNDKNKNRKIYKRNKLLLNQFNRTAQALPYATIILNKGYELRWVNSIAYKILGIKKSDIGVKISNLIRDPLFVELLEQVNQGTEVSEMKMTHPIDALRKIHIKLMKLSNKRFLLVARDISQQDALRQSRKAFVDNASHELRTPLTVITGYLEMLHNAKDIPKTWQQPIEKAQQQSMRMEKIINDMLMLSSIEHERHLEDNDEIIQMPQLLNRLLDDVKNSSKAKLHHFSVNIDSDLKIRGNEEEITSIILNLLNNAVKHTTANTKVSLRWFSKGNNAILKVCDNGKGIDAKHLPHLSERFYRVDNSRDKNTNSTGLGLAIVKQICDNHHATLEIESEIGKGTCFRIIFRQ